MSECGLRNHKIQVWNEEILFKWQNDEQLPQTPYLLSVAIFDFQIQLPFVWEIRKMIDLKFLQLSMYISEYVCGFKNCSVSAVGATADSCSHQFKWTNQTRIFTWTRKGNYSHALWINLVSCDECIYKKKKLKISILFVTMGNFPQQTTRL